MQVATNLAMTSQGQLGFSTLDSSSNYVDCYLTRTVYYEARTRGKEDNERLMMICSEPVWIALSRYPCHRGNYRTSYS